jgi:hypothetical protein
LHTSITLYALLACRTLRASLVPRNRCFIFPAGLTFGNNSRVAVCVVYATVNSAIMAYTCATIRHYDSTQTNNSRRNEHQGTGTDISHETLQPLATCL